MRPDKDLTKVYAVLVTFTFLNNHQNKQQIRMTIDKDHPKVCPVRNLAIMVVRKQKLGYFMDLSVKIYVNKKGEVKYLMSTKVTEILRKAVRKVYPDMSHDKVMK